MNTLAEGKVSPQEAEELLRAVGEESGQKLAVRRTLGFLISTLFIVVGFVLPWTHLPSMGLVPGGAYQAGYHVGAIGWIILVLGVLPTLLMCFPALDRHVQLAYLRLLFAGCGLALVSPRILALVAFVINLVVTPMGWQAREARPGIGIVLVLLGFAAQLFVAVAQSGFMRRREPKNAPTP